MSKPAEEIAAQILCAAAEGELLVKRGEGEYLGKELAIAFKHLYIQVLACQQGVPVEEIMDHYSK